MTAPVSAIGSRGMILAAGLGKRMRPLTLTRPKPMIEVAGKPLIAYAVDALALAGTEQVVVNVHHFASQIEDWCKAVATPKLVISDEREALLESGGGIVKALPLLGSEPFFLINSDTFWLDEGEANLVRLARTFDATSMDTLLMLAAHGQATGHGDKSDFTIGPYGRLARFAEAAGTGYIYAGAAILHPRIFNGAEPDAHSLNREFNAAIAAGRLFGMPMHGRWITVGTPDAIAPAEAVVAAFGKKS